MNRRDFCALLVAALPVAALRRGALRGADVETAIITSDESPLLRAIGTDELDVDWSTWTIPADAAGNPLSEDEFVWQSESPFWYEDSEG